MCVCVREREKDSLGSAFLTLYLKNLHVMIHALLRSLKWYKDGNEFYSYVPKMRTSPRRFFSTEGIDMNVRQVHGTSLWEVRAPDTFYILARADRGSGSLSQKCFPGNRGRIQVSGVWRGTPILHSGSDQDTQSGW